MSRPALAFAAAGLLLAATSAQAQTTLKLVTQTGAAATDARKVVPNLVAEEIAKANVGIEVKVYYDSQLIAAAEMWRAVREGTVDMAFVYLPAIARDIPELGILGMPTALAGYADVKPMAQSAATKEIAAVLESKGALLLAGYWDALSIGSTGDCIRRPVDLDGVVARGPGRPFEAVVEAAGAIPVPFASPEIPRALRTGAIDMVITTPASMLLGDGYKFLKCVTDTKGLVPGMVQTSMLVAKGTFEKLNAQQQAAIRAAFAKGADFMQAEVAKGSAAALDQMRAAGVKVVPLEEADMAAWRERSEPVALRSYAAASPAAASILRATRQALGRN